MTDSDQEKSGGQESVQQQSQEDIAKTLRLRSERPQVTRLSRRVLAGGAAFALAFVSGAVLWALQSNQKRNPAPEELFTTDHHNVADGLVGLPKDYAGIPRDVPRLGPPLPGDLGRPIVAAQNQSGPLAADAEQQRVNQESEAARISKVFANACASNSWFTRCCSASEPRADRISEADNRPAKMARQGRAEPLGAEIRHNPWVSRRAHLPHCGGRS